MFGRKESFIEQLAGARADNNADKERLLAELKNGGLEAGQPKSTAGYPLSHGDEYDFEQPHGTLRTWIRRVILAKLRL